MFTATLPARKSSKNTQARFLPAMDNDFSRVAGVLFIETDRSEEVGYVVEETPADADEAGAFNLRLFYLRKVGGTGTDATESLYCVRTRPELISPDFPASACSCKGFHFKQTCKHVDAIETLVKAGQL